jgi:DNA-binding Xre family transcriptional regulator
MSKMHPESAAACDPDTYAAETAEGEFVLAVQCEIQKRLNDKGLRARDLARRLGVTEARISQMFGDHAKNLTLKTIARIFHQLGGTPYLTSEQDYEQAVAVANGARRAEQAQWAISGPLDDLQTTPHIEIIEKLVTTDLPTSAHSIDLWVRAESAEEVKPRRLASVR